MDHLEQAIRASTEANNRQADHSEIWDDRPYIPDLLAEPAVEWSDTPIEAPPREEVQESPESPGPGSHQEPSTGRAETQGKENSRQDNQIVIDLEDVDAITTLSDIEPEELNDFAIECCHLQIESLYGDRSFEMMRFNKAIGI